MTEKTDFTPEEWNTVIAAPYYAAMLIVVSDMNVAYFKEIAAMAQAVMATVAGTENELLKQIAGDFSQKENQEKIKPELEGLKGEQDPSVIKQKMVDYVVATCDMVSAKGSEDGDVYRKWLLYLADVTAKGSKEGGFLGIGAVRVSEKEQAALDELAAALGVSLTE
jgi:hypothetical protein